MIGILARAIAPSLLALSCLAACVAANRVGDVTDEPRAVVLPADAVVLRGARAFAVAEIAYTVAASGATRLARAGLIRGEAARSLRRWNEEARRALVAGKSARDAVRQGRAAAILLDAADRVDAIAGGL